MLILKDIKKDYKIGDNVTHALKGVSLEFRRNEFVAILGPSGCGKTTLLNIIGGLDDYTSGNLLINHRSTKNFTSYDWDSYRNNSIGFVFQSYNLIMHQSIFANVELALTLSGMKRSERKMKVMEALAKVGLESEAQKRPYQLSGGQMQRVAIARALVNSPDIVLADEPTGALDGENSIQIMELLSEVAKDRLVIMVTHNPDLADKYATRIIKVADGLVVDDSAPYSEGWEIPETEDIEKTDKGKMFLRNFQNWWNPGLGDVTATPEEIEATKRKEDEAKAKAKAEKKIAKRTKTSMSFFSALRLSLSNIVTKKVRTTLTAIAGSIGIIGIALVLSLSSGVTDFLEKTEEDSLSQYPITITKNAVDVNTIVQTLTSTSENQEIESHPDSEEITVKNVLDNLFVKIVNNKEDILGENDMETIKKFCDNYVTEDLGNVKYSYGTTLNVYSNNGYKYDNGTGKLVAPDENSKYFIINPFDQAIAGALGGKFDMSTFGDIGKYASSFQVWDELIDNQNLLNQQYDLLGKSRWPEEANEIVLVVDEYNQIPDYIMFTLGLRDPADALSIISGNNTWEGMDLSVDSLIGTTYKVIADSDYYILSSTSEKGVPLYRAIDKTDDATLAEENIIESRGTDLKIVGVVRLKEGVDSGSIAGTIAYSNKLNEMMLQKIESSDVVIAQRNNPTVSVLTGKAINPNELEEYLEEKFGCANMDRPSSISIVPNSFESKEAIKTLIDTKYDEFARNLKNDQNAQNKTYKVKYTDTLEIIMGFVKQLTTTITGVLVGFSAISLIVSSIMIGIITYTSVLERTKEIGVLRSLGARKKDVSRVFLAETTIIGALSGIIGIVFTYAMTFPINIILENQFGISGLANLTWAPCVGLLAISIVLSDIAGLVPSKIASNKDPVTALRAE